jgi:hypothetical protein
VRERFFTPRLRVKSYEELNAWLLDKCVAYAKAHRHPELATDDLGGVRGGAAEPVPYAAASTASTRAGLGLEDLPGALRQQQVLGRGQRGRRPVEVHAYADRIVIRQDGGSSASMPAPSAAARRSTIPGTTCRCWPQARRAAQRRAVQGLGAAGRHGAGAAQAEAGATTATGRWSRS